ncbi:MAG: hypothetical protein Ct9H90mP16_18270 [Candidatus Poseidoniales archaeon]|nr:MAG: hypothetical protein Ct9H90mP16_18270 [Candidatus Poseidoniales archaeon]
MHLGLWLPNIEGCDFTIDPVPEECQVPVIAEIGPYYDDGDVDALTPADRLGRFLIENFVPHGYGVAQVSVFGTGESNHCMDLMGHDEQAGIKAAVDWLGSQPWSNGKMGAIGNRMTVDSLECGGKWFQISVNHCPNVWSHRCS